jgi:hypothetical protein
MKHRPHLYLVTCFRGLCSLLRFIAHLKAMDSTPLFCGGASSGLGGCGRLVHSGISTSSDSTQQHWRGPGSGAAASVVSMESRYFSRAQLAGLYNARLCQCQLEGVGCAVWCVSFVSCLFLKEKIIPSTPSGNALGAKHTLHVPQIACEHADQKAEYIFIRGAVSPQLWVHLLHEPKISFPNIHWKRFALAGIRYMHWDW